jgi:purine nucleosidase
MPQFPLLSRDFVTERLAPPTGCIRVVIDTDTANEIDDQFALAWALLRPDKLDVVAMTAEPFSFAHHLPGLHEAEAAMLAGTAHSEYLVGGFQGWINRLHRQGRRVDDLRLVGPAEGMERSYHEILRVYDACGIPHAGRVFRGADRYMTDVETPVVTEAATAIVDLAKSPGNGPLYIAALGCVTNIASAILMAPEIIRDIVVVWTSGYPSSAPHSNRPSLNLVQDLPASRILFDCGVPHVYLPGYHVGAQLKVSLPEMERFVQGRGAIGDLLHHLFTHNPLHDMFALDDTARRTWVIWDIINIAWLINPDWVPTWMTTSPRLDDALFWQKDPARHPMREAHDVQRDEIFLSFYDSLGHH